MSLNTEDRARLRQALEKATKGPWTLDIETDHADILEDELSGEDGLSIVIPEIGRALHDYDWAEPEDWPRDLANAELIALMRNTLPALLDRLDALEAAQGWRPMETAPKDGTFVLVFVPSTRRVHACMWDAEFDYVYDEGTEESRPRGAWTDHAVVSFGYEETAEYAPTHWMPLPPAPPAREARPQGEGAQ